MSTSLESLREEYQALRAQSTAWKLVGRARHTWHRSLLYLLAGRATPVCIMKPPLPIITGRCGHKALPSM